MRAKPWKSVGGRTLFVIFLCCLVRAAANGAAVPAADESAKKKPPEKKAPADSSETPKDSSPPKKANGPPKKKEPDPAPPGTKVSLAFKVPLHRKLLVTRSVKIEGKTQVSGGGLPKPVQTSTKLEDELQLIDELTAGGPGQWEGVRTVLKSRGQTNGEATDAPYAGVELGYSLANDTLQAAVKNDRQFSPESIQDLVRMGNTFSLALDLPGEAVVGGKQEIDLLALAPLLTSGELPPTAAKASCTLESFDRASGVGTLRGNLEMAEKGERDGMPISATYRGECVLRVHPGESRIISLHLEGTCETAADRKAPPMRMELSGKLTVDVATEIGDAVAKAAAGKWPARDRIQRVEELGLRFRLPGYYQRMTVSGAPQFLHTLDRSKGAAAILVSFIQDKATDKKVFYESLEATLKKTDPKVKMEKVRCFLGEGRAYLLDTGDKDAPRRVRSEVYPVKDGTWLMYKMVADPRRFAAVEKDFVKARSTLADLK